MDLCANNLSSISLQEVLHSPRRHHCDHHCCHCHTTVKFLYNALKSLGKRNNGSTAWQSHVPQCQKVNLSCQTSQLLHRSWTPVCCLWGISRILWRHPFHLSARKRLPQHLPNDSTSETGTQRQPIHTYQRLNLGQRNPDDEQVFKLSLRRSHEHELLATSFSLPRHMGGGFQPVASLLNLHIDIWLLYSL